MQAVIDLGEFEEFARRMEAFSRELTSTVRDAKKAAEAADYYPGPRVRTELFTDKGPAIGSVWLQVGFDTKPMVVKSIEDDRIEYEDGGWDHLRDFCKSVQTGKYYIGKQQLPSVKPAKKSNSKVTEVIVINDSDGHCTVAPKTFDNLKRLLSALLEACECNTMLDDEEEGKALLQKPDLTYEELEKYLQENAPLDRSGGGRIYFEKLESEDFQFDAMLFE